MLLALDEASTCLLLRALGGASLPVAAAGGGRDAVAVGQAA
jgi:hypothetical protein